MAGFLDFELPLQATVTAILVEHPKQANLTAEWDALHLLLQGQSRHPAPSTEYMKSCLSKADAEFRRCNEEIQCLQAQLVSLENEKMLIERIVSGYRTLLAPIRRVPPEILERILLFVCDENHVGEFTRFPPATLTKVCSFWNELVKSSPRLWSTIKYEFRPIDRSYVAGHTPVRLLKRLLKRSGSAPLCITVILRPAGRFGYSESWVPNALPFRMVKTLARHSKRWLTAFFSASSELIDGLRHVLNPIGGHLPLLKYLNFDSGYFERPRDHCITAFQNAPKLQSAILRHESSGLLSLPWNQLQSLKLVDSRFWYAILSMATTLKDCTLDGWDRWEGDGESDQPLKVTSNEVETLYLGLGTFDDIGVLSDLTFPKLTSFAISARHDDMLRPPTRTPIRFEQIASFLSRSSSVLTSLKWCNVPIDHATFISLLGNIPSLASLSIVENHEGTFQDVYGDWEDTADTAYDKPPPLVSDKLFENLVISPQCNDHIFLPNLQDISLSQTVSWDYEPCFTAQAFLDAVKCRWLREHCQVNVKRLRAVRLVTFNSAHLDQADISILRDFAHAGLNIVVRNESGLVLC